jgi:hypothetical protein
VAVIKGNIELAEVLLEAGAQPNLKDKAGTRPAQRPRLAAAAAAAAAWQQQRL